MANMHKRFVAEDEHLVINPNQSEKDQELREELARVKNQYQHALKEWRSEEHKDNLALKVLAQQLQRGLDQKESELQQALADKAAGISSTARAPIGEEDELAPSTSTVQMKAVLAKILRARFPANLFTAHSTAADAGNSGEAGSESTEPASHFFELWLNGQSTHMRTAGVPWASDCEWCDSFYLNDIGADAQLEIVWKYVKGVGGQTRTGGTAELKWSAVNLDPSKLGSNEVVMTLDITDKSGGAETWGDKLGTCSLLFSEVQVSGFSINRQISNSLIPPNEEHVAKCERLRDREIQMTQKRLKEAEGRIEAAQVTSRVKMW